MRRQGMSFEWQRDEYVVSTDKSRLDLGVIHRYLSEEAYWAQGRTADVVAQSIAHSECFGLYRGAEQVGFARAVTDYATFAWVADVFVLREYRGQGLGHWLMECVVSHPEMQNMRRWTLATRDAHEVYRSVGFKELPNPEKWMVRSGS
jgi:GNAT superfamily N-acetyltransferase